MLFLLIKKMAPSQTKMNYEGPIFIFDFGFTSIIVRFVPLVIDHNPGYKS